MRINGIYPGDESTYICTATNDIGVDEAHTQLIVFRMCTLEYVFEQETYYRQTND
jgi:hypothetical protein